MKFKSSYVFLKDTRIYSNKITSDSYFIERITCEENKDYRSEYTFDKYDVLDCIDHCNAEKVSKFEEIENFEDAIFCNNIDEKNNSLVQDIRDKLFTAIHIDNNYTAKSTRKKISDNCTIITEEIEIFNTEFEI